MPITVPGVRVVIAEPIRPALRRGASGVDFQWATSAAAYCGACLCDSLRCKWSSHDPPRSTVAGLCTI